MLTQRDKNILPGGRDHETAMRLLNEPGAVLQWRNPEINNPRWSDWMSLCPVPFREDIEWRIKPKTLRYRVALFSNGREFWPIVAKAEQQADNYAKFVEFVRWLTDWQEVEV